MATLSQKGLEPPQRVRQFVIQQTLDSFLASRSPALDAVPARRPSARDRTALLGKHWSPPGVAVGEYGAQAAPSGVGFPEAAGDPAASEDLPTFLRHRSLSRRLDDAFEDFYRGSMTEWLGDFFVALFRK